jgi:hypothetical protein
MVGKFNYLRGVMYPSHCSLSEMKQLEKASPQALCEMNSYTVPSLCKQTIHRTVNVAGQLIRRTFHT